MTTGILAIQGDFSKHQQILESLNCPTLLVKNRDDLYKCDGLVIPGGESTTLVNLLEKHHLWDDLFRYGRDKPIFGTCAGLILLARNLNNSTVHTMNLIDISVERNAYGRQIDSFIDTVDLNLDGKSRHFEGVFIRAPKITNVGKNVRILGHHNQEPVLVENRYILAATFHPELTHDAHIHRYFLAKIEKNRYDRS